MEENKIYCSHCGALIEDDDYETVNGEIVCTDCYENHTTTCDRCGSVIWTDDSYGDEYTTLCSNCYHNHYTRCSCCDALIHEDDAYHLDGYDYCSDCYHEEVDRNRSIHDYGYKPEPVFYGDSRRYFGVELEIDGAGKDSDNADELLAIANRAEEHIYIKGDGSLDDGMELVTHPMTLNYHKQFRWEEIMKKAIYLGYRSHQTSTCGLHVHVNRDCLGDNREEQDETISKILYFVENHWNELLKFSRRSEYAMNRWAARYGFEKTGREILDKAKKGNNGRYAAVNLMNYATIEFRMFRGTLKYNTFIAVGLYIYASTESIMKKALSKTCLGRFMSVKVDCIEGDILCIDSSGVITKEEFEPALYRSHFMSWYDDEPYYNVHEELLLAYCGCYGVDTADVEILLEYGYTCDEIEDMLADHSLLHETLCAIKGEEEFSLLEAF